MLTGLADLDLAALQRRRSIKWTSPLTNQLLLEAGFSMNYEQYVIVNQDGINQERGTPAWYAGTSKFDIARSTLWGGIGSGQGGRYPDRYNFAASASYVTGSHNVKAGFQYNWGPYENTRDTNADLQQRYNERGAHPGPCLQHADSLPGAADRRSSVSTRRIPGR